MIKPHYKGLNLHKISDCAFSYDKSRRVSLKILVFALFEWENIRFYQFSEIVMFVEYSMEML